MAHDLYPWYLRLFPEKSLFSERFVVRPHEGPVEDGGEFETQGAHACNFDRVWRKFGRFFATNEIQNMFFTYFFNKLDFYVFQDISLHRGTEEEISFVVGHAALQEIHVLNIHQTHVWYTLKNTQKTWAEEEHVKKTEETTETRWRCVKCVKEEKPQVGSAKQKMQDHSCLTVSQNTHASDWCTCKTLGGKPNSFSSPLFPYRVHCIAIYKDGQALQLDCCTLFAWVHSCGALYAAQMNYTCTTHAVK